MSRIGLEAGVEEILFHGFSISPWTNSSLCTTAIYDIHRRRWRRSSTADTDGSDVDVSVDRLVLDVDVHSSSPGPARTRRAGPTRNKGPKGPSPLPGEGAGGRDTGGKQECC